MGGFNGTLPAAIAELTEDQVIGWCGAMVGLRDGAGTGDDRPQASGAADPSEWTPANLPTLATYRSTFEAVGKRMPDSEWERSYREFVTEMRRGSDG